MRGHLGSPYPLTNTDTDCVLFKGFIVFQKFGARTHFGDLFSNGLCPCYWFPDPRTDCEVGTGFLKNLVQNVYRRFKLSEIHTNQKI